MFNINKVDYWNEPTDLLRCQPGYKRQMSRSDHGFLSGIIKKIHPKKIVEVGVAEGGTTRLILKTLEMMECDCRVFSIDCMQQYKGKRVGFTLSDKDLNGYVDHSFHLGKYLVDIVEEIGKDIDLIILDTTHMVPGEILDFLCVFPFLSKDAFVIVHDVCISNQYARRKDKVANSLFSIAGKLLFTVVTANKCYNFSENEFENIAAFQITDETFAHIPDIFYSLSFVWLTSLKKEDILKYREFFTMHYDSKCIEIFDLCLKNQMEYKDNINTFYKNRRLVNEILFKPLSFKNIKIRIYNRLLDFLKPRENSELSRSSK